MTSAPWLENFTRRWIRASDLRSTYLVFMVPGGAAAEVCVGAPAGASHLLEHLLYRQNHLAGEPLDRLGGNFSLLTRAETVHAIAGFAPGDIGRAAELVEAWWRQPAIPEPLLAEEIEVVCDEIGQANRVATRLAWAALTSAIAPRSHLARDFAGVDHTLRQLRPSGILEIQADMRALGGVSVALGPQSPWPDELSQSQGPVFRPPRVEPATSSSVVRRKVQGMGHAIVAAGRAVSGLRSPSALGSYAMFSALNHGRLHPSQSLYHRTLRLRYLYVDLKMYADMGFLIAMARCPSARIDDVVGLLVQMLDCPLSGSDGTRLKKCARYQLGWLHDNADSRVVDEAARALYGAASLQDQLAAADATPERAFPSLVEAALLGPTQCTVLEI